MELKGTQSEKNLQTALAGESIARNKYSYFAAAARKAGDAAVAEAFERMAQNEMAHAKLWFEFLYGAPGSSLENLMAAAQGEFGEWHSMYPGFAEQAREDGLPELAMMFEAVAKIERDHEMQFMTLYAKLAGDKKEPDTVEVSPQQAPKTGYRCQFCGASFDERLDVCPVCQAIGAMEKIS